jgi:hypothetical protein
MAFPSRFVAGNSIVWWESWRWEDIPNSGLSGIIDPAEWVFTRWIWRPSSGFVRYYCGIPEPKMTQYVWMTGGGCVLIDPADWDFSRTKVKDKCVRFFSIPSSKDRWRFAWETTQFLPGNYVSHAYLANKTNPDTFFVWDEVDFEVLKEGYIFCMG